MYSMIVKKLYQMIVKTSLFEYGHYAHRGTSQLARHLSLVARKIVIRYYNNFAIHRSIFCMKHYLYKRQRTKAGRRGSLVSTRSYVCFYEASELVFRIGILLLSEHRRWRSGVRFNILEQIPSRKILLHVFVL